MADIAAAAGMSAGLIYRYFDGKNQIVQAIIEQHLETDGCPSMGNLNTSEDFCARAMEMFERWRRRDDPHMNAALMLELTAEAARDPEILSITRGKDETIMQMMTLAVQRAAARKGCDSPRPPRSCARWCCSVWSRGSPVVPCAARTCRCGS